MCLYHLGPCLYVKCGHVTLPGSMHSPGSAPSSPVSGACALKLVPERSLWGGVGPPQSLTPTSRCVCLGEGMNLYIGALENLGVPLPPVQTLLPSQAPRGLRNNSSVPGVSGIMGQDSGRLHESPGGVWAGFGDQGRGPRGGAQAGQKEGISSRWEGLELGARYLPCKKR